MPIVIALIAVYNEHDPQDRLVVLLSGRDSKAAGVLEPVHGQRDRAHGLVIVGLYHGTKMGKDPVAGSPPSSDKFR